MRWPLCLSTRASDQLILKQFQQWSATYRIQDMPCLIFSSSSAFLGCTMYVCVCLRTGVYAGGGCIIICVSMREGQKLAFSVLSLSRLRFETGSLTEPRACSFHYTDWSASPRALTTSITSSSVPKHMLFTWELRIWTQVCCFPFEQGAVS